MLLVVLLVAGFAQTTNGGVYKLGAASEANNGPGSNRRNDGFHGHNNGFNGAHHGLTNDHRMMMMQRILESQPNREQLINLLCTYNLHEQRNELTSLICEYRNTGLPDQPGFTTQPTTQAPTRQPFFPAGTTQRTFFPTQPTQRSPLPTQSTRRPFQPNQNLGGTTRRSFPVQSTQLPGSDTVVDREQLIELLNAFGLQTNGASSNQRPPFTPTLQPPLESTVLPGTNEVVDRNQLLDLLNVFGFQTVDRDRSRPNVVPTIANQPRPTPQYPGVPPQRSTQRQTQRPTQRPTQRQTFPQYPTTQRPTQRQTFPQFQTQAPFPPRTQNPIYAPAPNNQQPTQRPTYTAITPPPTRATTGFPTRPTARFQFLTQPTRQTQRPINQPPTQPPYAPATQFPTVQSRQTRAPFQTPPPARTPLPFQTQRPVSQPPPFNPYGQFPPNQPTRFQPQTPPPTQPPTRFQPQSRQPTTASASIRPLFPTRQTTQPPLQPPVQQPYGGAGPVSTGGTSGSSTGGLSPGQITQILETSGNQSPENIQQIINLLELFNGGPSSSGQGPTASVLSGPNSRINGFNSIQRPNPEIGAAPSPPDVGVGSGNKCNVVPDGQDLRCPWEVLREGRQVKLWPTNFAMVQCETQVATQRDCQILCEIAGPACASIHYCDGCVETNCRLLTGTANIEAPLVRSFAFVNYLEKGLCRSRF